MKNETTQITIRFSKRLFKLIEEDAKKTERSRRGMIEYIVKDYYERMGKYSTEIEEDTPAP